MPKLKYSETADFIVFSKPIGLNTHKVDIGKEGLVEFLEEKIQTKLHVLSRLDQQTSGLILFAKDLSVQRLNEVWNSKETKKSYLLLTESIPDIAKFKKMGSQFLNLCEDHTEEKPHFIFKSHIYKRDSQFVSELNLNELNSETEFIFLKKVNSYFLWKAILHTGKTHQIRLHCQNLNSSILGDTLYGGKSFYRLCLHSYELKIDDQTIQSDWPLWSEESTNADKNLKLKFWKLSIPEQQVAEAIHWRKNVYDVSKDECFRWLHQEVPGLKIDQYGPNIYVYDYKEWIQENPNLLFLISELLQKPLLIRKMQNRGGDPNQNSLYRYDVELAALKEMSAPMFWHAQEYNLKVELRTEQGLSPGLFLDQSENRNWVFENSKDKDVLNLFSYTGGFSVAAALGKAKKVDTVDVSKNFISWSEDNFKLNGVNLDDKKCSFWTQDCLFFLEMSIKKNKKWDLIICDPPTFGRSKFGVFQLEKQFDKLWNYIFDALNPNGYVLFSVNYEKWDQKEFLQQIRKALRNKKYEIRRTPLQRLDFDFPHQEYLMKSVLIKRC